MKKVMIIAGTLFLVVTLFSSCKSHETCPAYGALDTEQTTKIKA